MLLVYGEMDGNCPNCYILSFLPEWYPNLHVLRYPGYNHNYFDIDGKNHWDEVVGDVWKWVMAD